MAPRGPGAAINADTSSTVVGAATSATVPATRPHPVRTFREVAGSTDVAAVADETSDDIDADPHEDDEDETADDQDAVGGDRVFGRLAAAGVDQHGVTQDGHRERQDRQPRQRPRQSAVTLERPQ